MNMGIRRIGVIWLLPVVAGSVLGVLGSRYLPMSASAQLERQAAIVPPVRFKVVSVKLPDSTLPFPQGIGHKLAEGHCVMCHSPRMVLEQPALTEKEWYKVTEKMRAHFGAPVPESDVRALAHYFSVINGRPDDSGPSLVDDQAS
jgi:hypothetical protein